MKTVCYFIVFICLSSVLAAQEYDSRKGLVRFESNAPMELIQSETNRTYSTLHTGSGKITCSVQVRSFQFEKPMMYKHFNENYLETHKFPKATFTGYIQNVGEVNFNVPGQYTAMVKGELYMHGVKRNVIVESKVTVGKKTIRMTTSLSVVLSDYDIAIPDFVRENIAKEVQLDMDISFESSRLVP